MSDELKSLQFVDLSLTINGKSWEGSIPAEETLLEFVRNRLGLTGTKRSCESEVCGACTVLVDNQAVSSCNYLAFEAEGRSVLTIEGLEVEGKLDPLQEAFIRNVGARAVIARPGRLWRPRRFFWRIRHRRETRLPNGLAGTSAAAELIPR